VFARDGDGNWTQQGSKLIGSGAVGPARQGTDVAISADGNTVMFTGPYDNAAAGAAWVFIRDGAGNWIQQGPKLVGSGTSGTSYQISAALSADGNTAAIGGTQDNNTTGATWVFTRDGAGNWSQQGNKLVGSGAANTSRQGSAVALSADGSTLAVGALSDDGGRGAMWVFIRDGAGNWTQQGGMLTADDTVGISALGGSIALAADGNSLIVGSQQDDGAAGAAWLFARDGNGLWTQQGGKLAGAGDSVAMAADGNTVIVGDGCDNNCIGLARVFVQPAIVTSVSPNAGPIEGSLVRIVGQHFTGATAVTFGGVAATDLLVVDDSFLVATTPAHAAATVDVAVTTSGGTVISAGAYTYDGEATSTVLLSSANPAEFGQPVTFTAVVGSNGMPTGTVTFMDGATLLGSAPLSASVATLTTAALAGGPHTITAAYAGDGTFVPSTSPALAQTVSPIATATVLTARPNPAIPGRVVKLIATVTAVAPSGGTPAGTVTFRRGARLLGSATLSPAGKATLNTAALAIGANRITASYGGNASWAASTSTPLRQMIEARRGRQIKVNSFNGTKANRKQRPAVASLADGRYVVVWQSQGQDKSGGGIYGQRYKWSGARDGTEFRVNTVTASGQTDPDVAALADGGFVVVWTSRDQDGSGLGIYGQRYKKNGAPRGAAFRINTTTRNDQQAPSVAGLGNGGFVVTWVSNAHPRFGDDIRGQRYDRTGAKIGREFVVNTTRVKNQTQPAVAALSNGFVVTWTSDARARFGSDIVGQRYNRRGIELGGDFLINTTRGKNQMQPAVVGTGAGEFVVAWTSAGQDGSGLGVYAQRFRNSGTRNGAEFRVNRSTHNSQSEPALTGFADGGFVAVWTARGKDGSGKGVYGQGYDKDGATVSTEFRVNTATADDQWQPSAATLSASTFVVVWTAIHPATSRQRIDGQRFTFRGL
jgi:hypothetical protein